LGQNFKSNHPSLKNDDLPHLSRLILCDKELLICKGQNSMSQGSLKQKKMSPTKVESAFSHRFSYITAQKGTNSMSQALTD